MSIKEIERIADLEYYLDRYGAYHTKKALRSLANTFGIQRYSINLDYHMDVEGNVEISFYNIAQLPIHFNEVRGNFTITFNKLSSMVGYPKKIYGFMQSEGNRIADLTGLPLYVGKDCCILETKMLDDMNFDWTNIHIGENLSSFSRQKIETLEQYYIKITNECYSFQMPFSQFKAAKLHEKLQTELDVANTTKLKRKI